MDYEMFFSIGELAKLCGVTPKTLRFYDKLGLLKPATVNTQNGYRYYTRWHITRVNTIKQLQEIGFTLQDIRAFLRQDNTVDIVDSLSAMLAMQRHKIEDQLEALTSKLESVEAMQHQCETLKHKLDFDDKTGLILREIPERTILCISYQGEYTPALFQEAYQKIVSSLEINPSNTKEPILLSGPMAIYEPSPSLAELNIKLGYEVDAGILSPFPTFTIEKALFACFVFKGSYTEMHSNAYQKLYKEISELGYHSLAPHIEYYYVNEAVTSADNYLTEIQIPIKKA